MAILQAAFPFMPNAIDFIPCEYQFFVDVSFPSTGSRKWLSFYEYAFDISNDFCVFDIKTIGVFL